MKVLTMKQPWASAIIHGPKDVENREWALWPDVLGQWVFIQAGLAWDKERGAGALEQWLIEDRRSVQAVFQDALIDDGPGKLPAGVVIGAARFEAVLAPSADAEIVRCATRADDQGLLWDALSNEQAAQARALKWWMQDQYGWVCAQRVAFREPVPAKGSHKLWTPAPDLLLACRAQLATALAA